MTARINSTDKQRQGERRPQEAGRSGTIGQSIQSSVCHALVMLGMGIEGMSCGGDITPPGKR